MHHYRLATAGLLVMACGQLIGCSGDQARGDSELSPMPSGVDASMAKRDLEGVGEAMRLLRDAEGGSDLRDRYGLLNVHAHRFDMALMQIEDGYAATVQVGQSRLDTDAQPGQSRGSQPGASLRTQHDDDLQLAMESLRMCRQPLAIVAGAYRTQLDELTRTLDSDVSLPSRHAVDPVMAKLLENESEEHSVLIDVAAKSHAVLAELCSLMVPRD